MENEVAEKNRQIEFPQFLRVQKCNQQILRYFRPKKVCSEVGLLNALIKKTASFSAAIAWCVRTWHKTPGDIPIKKVGLIEEDDMWDGAKTFEMIAYSQVWMKSCDHVFERSGAYVHCPCVETVREL